MQNDLVFSGILGSVLALAIGDFTKALYILVFLMVLDYALGIICAFVFGSSKHGDGNISSGECVKGIFRKIGMLAMVAVAYQIDNITGNTFIRDASIVTLSVSEIISILENLKNMGVPIPENITAGIKQLKGAKKK